MTTGEQPPPGNATVSVVRVGDTVRRPAGQWTDTTPHRDIWSGRRAAGG
ncbi:hypothetical protein [Micromonospora rubida]|nr:hypothetical protein [Micromonospora rubida]NBE79777.1 hypothetical protein [Micromonospora rubida]